MEKNYYLINNAYIHINVYTVLKKIMIVIYINIDKFVSIKFKFTLDIELSNSLESNMLLRKRR